MGQVDTGLKLLSTLLEGLVSFPNPFTFHSSLKDPNAPHIPVGSFQLLYALSREDCSYYNSVGHGQYYFHLLITYYLLGMVQNVLSIFSHLILNNSTKEVLVSQFIEKNTRAQGRGCLQKFRYFRAEIQTQVGLTKVHALDLPKVLKQCQVAAVLPCSTCRKEVHAIVSYLSGTEKKPV